MSEAVLSFRYNELTIFSSDGNKKIDLSSSVVNLDYYEDLLSPCVTATMIISSSYSIFNGLPIRGGEKVHINLSTSNGDFELIDDYALYVYKVANLITDGTTETFALHLCSREALSNETIRVNRNYKKATIDQHVTDILDKVLATKKYKKENIEKTSNSYSFIGTLKKPFHILTWLGPKAIPSTSSGGSGTSGSSGKGVAGYMFYENKDGFNFRSIETLVSPTKSQVGSNDKENIPTYIFTQIVEAGSPKNDFTILNYSLEKNTDLMKSLRVGLYSNITYTFDLYNNKFAKYTYKISEEVKSKLGTESVIAPEGFSSSPTRILYRTIDSGTLDPSNKEANSGRDTTDMAKSFSRYNLLFTQSLNMVVPCNISLRVGSIINAEFQDVSASDGGSESEKQQSGKYLIKELRHHFEGGQVVTALKLIRDSYGLY
jgi:hypothetical protein